MNDKAKRHKTYGKAIVIILNSLILFVLLLWLPTTIEAADTSTVYHEISLATIQNTPAVDPTVTALNKQKLENDTSWWFNNAVTLITSLATTVALLIGAIFALYRWSVDRNAERERRKEEHYQQLAAQQIEREKRDEEQQRWLHDREAEREKHGEERFQAVVEGLGNTIQAAQVGAAITLRTFLRPGYEQFYRQVFDLAVAHLRLRNVDPARAELLNSLNQALITIFKESFPRARQQLEFTMYMQQLTDKMYMQQLDATAVQLDHAYLAYADLRSIWMPYTNLRNADLSRAILSSALLSYANLSYANLSGADLTNADLRKAQLSYAIFSSVYLNGAYLSEADLSEANLVKASLIKASLIKANLSGADLSGANLTNANLSRANLSGASLTNTNLSEADLSEADLSGATFSNNNQGMRTKLLNVKGLTPSKLAEFQRKGAIIEDEDKKTM